MDLTPPVPLADEPNDLIAPPSGCAAKRWHNITIEETTTGLGPFQTRRDHYRITISGGQQSNRPPLQLPLGGRFNESILRRHVEFATSCTTWWDDDSRRWHDTFIRSMEIQRFPTHAIVTATVEHPYLD